MQRKHTALIISPLFLLACIISYVSSAPPSALGLNHNVPGTLSILGTSSPEERYMLNATTILWSPDGKYLAFNSRHDGDGDVYLIDFFNYLHTSSQQKSAVLLNVTDTEREEGPFSWSPDSQHIVVSAYQGDNVYIVDIHDKETIRLTTTNVSESNPVWSPDGKYIVFDSQNNEGRRILRTHVTQRDTIVLTDGAFPRWSADGARLAFMTSTTSAEDVGTSLNVTDVDGRNTSVLLPKSMFIAAHWSPNDDVLAYTGYFEGHFQLGIVDSHSQQRRLLLTALEPAFVTGWSFDGKKLSILSDMGGNQEVYILSLADNKVTQITRTEFDEHYPTWSPTENMLAYWSVNPIRNEQNLVVQDMSDGKKYLLIAIPLYYSSFAAQHTK